MSCVHHWIIDTLATNGEYHAKCKLCKETNTFYNSFYDVYRFPTAQERKHWGISDNTRKSGWVVKPKVTSSPTDD